MTQSYLTQLYTNTLSNQNIATALNTGTYTEPGTRLRKLFITIFADQIAGNGNYTAYVTRQIAGAGSAYEVGQRTIVAVPSGVTAQAFQTIAVLCGVSDVIKTYIVGLGGDTTTPDIITNVVEEFVGVGADGNALISTDTQDLSATLSVNTKKVNGTTQTARDLGLALPAAAPNAAGGLLITAAGSLDMDDIGADVDAIETRVTTALPNAAPQAAGGLITSAAGSLDMDDLAADVDATETRVVLALPNAAPQAAGGLVTSAAGSLDFDDLAADVDATETRVVLALPAAAPQAAGGLITSIAGSFDIDEMNADVEAIQTGVAAIPTNPLLTTDSRLDEIAETGADVDELITTIGVSGAGLTAVTVDALSAAALADFFDVDSGKVYSDAIAGSVVKEIVLNSIVPFTVADIVDGVWGELIADLLGYGINTVGWNLAYRLVNGVLIENSVQDLTNVHVDTKTLNTVPVATYASQIAVNAAIQVWESALADFLDAGTFGLFVQNLPTATAPTALQNADALLNRDMSAVSDTNARSPLNALRFLRNKWGVSGATLTVKKEDDTTTAWTATVASDAGAVPIVGNDPS